MDIVAHVLWAGVGTAAAARRWRITPRMAMATVALAAMPDLLQFAPLLAWVLLGDGSWSALSAYAVSLPGQEPALPPLVLLVSHHLHCAAHSALVAAAATLAIRLAAHSWWLPLAGWWSHIVIDVFTHSADFYPAPVLYPLTYSGFDGIAWNKPWFMALNYGLLLVAGVWVLRLCAKSSRDEGPARTMGESPCKGEKP